MTRDFIMGSLHLDAMLGENVSWCPSPGTSKKRSRRCRTSAVPRPCSSTSTPSTPWFPRNCGSRAQRRSSTGWWAATTSTPITRASPTGSVVPTRPIVFLGFPSGCSLFAGGDVRGSFDLSVATPHRLVDNTALFGSLTWHVSNKVTLIADARFARETLDYGSVMAVDGVERKLKDDFDSFTPRVVFDWKPNDYSTIYASISTGTKPGNFNAEIAQMCESCIGEFEDEYGIGVAIPESEAVNYEAGYKLVTRNGKHRFNAAAFYFDWTNQAFTQAVFGFDTNGDGSWMRTTSSRSTTRRLPANPKSRASSSSTAAGWAGSSTSRRPTTTTTPSTWCSKAPFTAGSSAARTRRARPCRAAPRAREPSVSVSSFPSRDLGIQRPRRLPLPRLVLHLGGQPGRDRRHQPDQPPDRFPQRPLGLLDLDEQRHRRRHPDGHPAVLRAGELLPAHLVGRPARCPGDRCDRRVSSSSQPLDPSSTTTAALRGGGFLVRQSKPGADTAL